jgi:hypothetical protein
MDQATRTEIAAQQRRWLTSLLTGQAFPYVAVCDGAVAMARHKLERHVRRRLREYFPVTAAVMRLDLAALVLPLARLGQTLSHREAIEELFRVLRPRLRRAPRGTALDRLLCLERAVALARTSRGVRVSEAALARVLARAPGPRSIRRGAGAGAAMFYAETSQALLDWYAPTHTTLPRTVRGQRTVAAVFKDARTGAIRIATAAIAPRG